MCGICGFMDNRMAISQEKLEALAERPSVWPTA